MELKLKKDEDDRIDYISSNCTNMELKLENPKGSVRSGTASNCTNMELKLEIATEKIPAMRLLLIAPIWN